MFLPEIAHANNQPGATANCINRDCARNEFTNNPEAIANLCGLTKVEVGLQSKECAQMFIESVMNRAAALSGSPGSCSNSVQSRLNDTAYWGAGNKRLQNNAAEFEICQQALAGALRGENLSNYATDNASAGLAQRRKAAGNPGVDCEYAAGQNEFFYTNINGSGGGGVPAHGAWREAQEASNGQACTPHNMPAQPNLTEDRDEEAAPPPESPPPSSTPGATPGGSTTPEQSFQNGMNNLSTALKYIWVATLQMMTTQLTSVMMEQVLAVGTFFDAKNQLETQRLMQQKTAQAHKDYHPSLQMCEVGTFVRNLSNTEKRAQLTKNAMSRSALDRMLGTGDVSTVGGTISDRKTKMVTYLDMFCSPDDNGKQNQRICNNEDRSRANADINFTQTIGSPLTIPLNVMDSTIEPEEETLFVLLDYLFMHNSVPKVSDTVVDGLPFEEPYQNMRSLIAMRSVAQNSMAHIIGEKTQSTDEQEESVSPFIYALMEELGIEPNEIEKTIGKNPSYYAQMEVLTKKIYQHPEFIANLYDKPANVKRLKAAMTAIKLMQDRDIHNALMRREMLMSLLLEIQLREDQQDALTQEIDTIIDLSVLPPHF
jgi:hypothetical protein